MLEQQRRPSDHVEGERVLGPPRGTYDADWVAAAAVEAGVPVPEARSLALRAWELLRSGTPASALPGALGGPHGAVVAATALESCSLYEVPLTGG